MKTKRVSMTQLWVLVLLLLFLPPDGQAQKTLTVLHSFTNSGGDGAKPSSDFITDGASNLYGTTISGGANGYGTVFELDASNYYAETVLYSFTNSGGDGASPFAGLQMDSAGNLYGTTESGGANGYGTVFELSPPGTPGGTWTETVLHSFANSGGDGGGSPCLSDP